MLSDVDVNAVGFNDPLGRPAHLRESVRVKGGRCRLREERQDGGRSPVEYLKHSETK